MTRAAQGLCHQPRDPLQEDEAIRHRNGRLRGLAEQPLQEFIAREAGVPRHIAENVVQRPQFQWIVVGNGKVVFAALTGARQP